jgi:hypothetical protein
LSICIPTQPKEREREEIEISKYLRKIEIQMFEETKGHKVGRMERGDICYVWLARCILELESPDTGEGWERYTRRMETEGRGEGRNSFLGYTIWAD